ncbi:class I SAM-dependent methyltransferase [Rhizobium sp. XQZ8]|uniref:class I SAM-dependent methyltransferase n=1 Tax=Rhizobium populisoli TaxID=2859785 RepID=UPI001CA4F4C8|nr:class I SAM-dependent methyltransferase [Rhizobium populisoli]MBW6422399.1 class I SAM-dependent methyltransferase [Rhizobium populisoli]
MSRLDSFIARMSAQRDILNHIHQNGLLIEEGAVLEIGLGNGRTYSHLRQLFPERRIVVFDRQMGAHRTLLPEPEDFIMGEISETARQFAGSNAALVHADIGTGYPDKDAMVMEWLPDVVASALAKNGIAVSGLRLDHPSLIQLTDLPSTKLGSYQFYRRS